MSKQLGKPYFKGPNEHYVEGGVAHIIIESMRYGRRVALVDEERFDLVRDSRWSINHGTTAYAQQTMHPHLQMHSVVFPECPSGLVRDHINGDGLDNRAANVRFVTRSRNSLNRRKRKYMPGVRYMRNQKGPKKFQGVLSLGYYDTEVEAHIAYIKAYHRFHGAVPYGN